MKSFLEAPTTGLPELDRILNGLRPGDNVVWSVDRLEDYRYFVRPFIETALRQSRKVVMIGFGDHPPLYESHPSIAVYHLEAAHGFESFAVGVHEIISAQGRETYYVFDCLSDLLTAWATDVMIGHFFQVTCPYLFELETVAYFCLLRDSHSYQTIEKIRSTTQLLLEVYYHEERIYLHPLKVWQRYSPTMFLPHEHSGEGWEPIADSFRATRLLHQVSPLGAGGPERRLDYWDRLFLQARQIVEEPVAAKTRTAMVEQLNRVMIGRDERILDMAGLYFTLRDLLEIQRRMIGTGFVGGKAVGMLLARAILRREAPDIWEKSLEEPDSYYVGSDVYYAYIVHNGCWRLLMRQKTPDGYLEAAAELEQRLRNGTFPEELAREFQMLLEYYGQYPIIVRSSSLLEDSFGNAFAGKYETYFLVNQGPLEQRWEALAEAIRKIYASTMSRDALIYRRQRGLDRREEQMALLIQRVSGAYRNGLYFPEVAGVAVSYNTFVWDKELDPKAGMLRIVLGLGTRAVDRVAGDYPRLVALDNPARLPHKSIQDTRRYSQREVDLLDLRENCFRTVSLPDLLLEHLPIVWERYMVTDWETTRIRKSRSGRPEEVRLLTFEKLLTETPFSQLMRRILKTLEAAYQYPVDVEFTMNHAPDGSMRLNLVQCRPLQTKGSDPRIRIPEDIDERTIFIAQESRFSGGSVSFILRRVVYVDPQAYLALDPARRRNVTRLIGALNRRLEENKEPRTLLLGPGRWGTSTPGLGIPITFADISRITALGEVAFVTGGLIPELSYGSHFFQDLVENDIFYLAIFPHSPGQRFDLNWLGSQPNQLPQLEPEFASLAQAVRVVDVPEGLHLLADVVTQQLVVYRLA
ncbi:MAG: PEP/pyruvate-binding domain-containing protein [Deltaproteobacteria bacterium]|nr:PEP/pyruvate-binding domain-containing protein [Deltaproteobacteria bacterium]